jgi:hypothetical protein
MIQEICPLCGADNKCAAVGGEEARECWCMRVSIPAELLARVPESLLGVSCICRDCVERYNVDALDDPGSRKG